MESKKLVDLTYLYEISDGSDNLINDLFEMFFKQIPEYQDLLIGFYEKRDFYNLGRIAHKAKSAILMLGLKDLANELKKLEENAKEGKNFNEYQEIIAKFVRDSNIALEELKEIKNNK